MKKILIILTILIIVGAGTSIFFLLPQMEKQKQADQFIAEIERYAFIDMDKFKTQTKEISEYMDDDSYIGLEQSLQALSQIDPASTSSSSTRREVKEAEESSEAKEIIEGLEGKYQEARKTYNQMITDYREAKKTIDQALKKLQAKEKVLELENYSLNFFKNTFKCLKTRHQVIEAWIMAKILFENEAKMSILERINQDISYIEDLEDQLEMPDLDMIKKTASSTLAYYTVNRARTKKLIGLILTSRLDKVNIEAREFSDKIIKEKEQDSNSLEITGKINLLSEKITFVEKELTAARENFNSIRGDLDTLEASGIAELNNLFNSGYAHVVEADRAIEQAYQELKIIVEEMGGMINYN